MAVYPTSLLRLCLNQSKGPSLIQLKKRLKAEIFNEEENKKLYFDSIARLDLDNFLDLA